MVDLYHTKAQVIKIHLCISPCIKAMYITQCECFLKHTEHVLYTVHHLIPMGIFGIPSKSDKTCLVNVWLHIN